MTILALRSKIFGRYSHAVCRVKLPEKGGESNQLALVKSTEPDRNRVTHTEILFISELNSSNLEAGTTALTFGYGYLPTMGCDDVLNDS